MLHASTRHLYLICSDLGTSTGMLSQSIATDETENRTPLNYCLVRGYQKTALYWTTEPENKRVWPTLSQALFSYQIRYMKSNWCWYNVLLWSKYFFEILNIPRAQNTLVLTSVWILMAIWVTKWHLWCSWSNSPILSLWLISLELSCYLQTQGQCQLLYITIFESCLFTRYFFGWMALPFTEGWEPPL